MDLGIFPKQLMKDEGSGIKPFVDEYMFQGVIRPLLSHKVGPDAFSICGIHILYERRSIAPKACFKVS